MDLKGITMNNNKVPDSLSETKIQYYFQQDQDKVFHGVIPKFFQNIRLEDLRQILPTPRKDEYTVLDQADGQE